MGVATGIAIGSLIASSAAQAYGAHKAASASKDAAKLQTAAADRASKIYDDTYQPYLNKGRESISTLGRLTAAPAGSRYAAPDPTRPPQSAPPAPRPGMSGPPRPAPGTLGSMAPSGPGAPPGMVMIEARDGSGVRPVPEAQAQRFLSQPDKFRRVS